MKKLLLTEMLLLSNIEKKARKIKFHPNKTIFLGKNDTGKSCLTKSIFNAFGAETVHHNKWKNSNISILLKFSLNGESYSILKNDTIYSIFNSDNKLLNAFTKITHGLSPYLADLFDFRLRLVTPKGELIQALPAYLFLPYYIDQDKSWNKKLNSFERLQQFSKWQNDLLEYHMGIKPNKYYDLKSRLTIKKNELSEHKSELEIHETLLTKSENKLNILDYDIDINVFKNEIKRLMEKCNIIKSSEEKIKYKLIELYNNKSIIMNQIEMANNALKEVDLDYKYATKSLPSGQIECPTCGAEYENTAIERLSIAQDEEKCNDLLHDLKHELLLINNSIVETNSSLTNTTSEITEIMNILEEKKGELKFRTIIENEGKKELKNLLVGEIDEHKELVLSKESEIHEIEIELKQFSRSDLKIEIINKYILYMSSYLDKLNVPTLEQKDYKNINARINETGSDLPRALLAYYYSVLNVIREYTSSTFCPIVIDSPNQQAQDPESLKKIIKFIKENTPSDSQLILATENLCGIDFNGSIIELNKKYSVLNEKDFPMVKEEFNDFINQSFNAFK